MPMLSPLRFTPLFKEYLWGGRRLEAILGKRLGDGPTYAESWEVVDHGDDQSQVAGGPLAGKTLHEIANERGEELFGRHYPQRQFPLLFKFLDAKQTLSVQVHPNDEQGAGLDPPDLGKTEAWVVLAAEPGSRIYAGLQKGVDCQTLAAAIEAGRCETCLHVLEPVVGDCLLIEAGTVHAIGAGIVLAEIQQASNTTFRLFDWNRTDADGKSRQLHVEQSLATIDFHRGPVDPQLPLIATTSGGASGGERLIECDKFLLDRYCRRKKWRLDLTNRFHLLSVTQGEMTLSWREGEEVLHLGETVLVPASCGEVTLTPKGECGWLDMHLPD